MIGDVKANVKILIDSFEQLDFTELADKVRLAINENPKDNQLATLALEVMSFSENKHNKKVESLLKKSKVNELLSFDNLLKYPERQLDLELIQDLSELHFLNSHENIILWGPPGTGKTWIAKALMNNACQRHIRSLWTTFPLLCRDIEGKHRKSKNSNFVNAYDSRLKYYANIPLLCIDEFPNCKIEDIFIVQEFFNLRCLSNKSTIICSQASPEKWPDLFDVRSFGESIRGRLIQNAKVVAMKGPDLRVFKPSID